MNPENLKQGWYKSYRSKWNNPRSSDPDWVSVWDWLLCHATHRPRDFIWKGQRITLKPGQLITGRHAISKATGVNESKVKRLLNLLKSDQQIDQQTSNASSMITITNWDAYQQCDQQNGQPVTSEWTTSDQPVTTNKKDKKQKNEENLPPQPPAGGGGELALEVSPVPEKDPLEVPQSLRTQKFLNAWQRWMTFRRGMKRVKDWVGLFQAQLRFLGRYDSDTATEILEASLRNGWQGLFEPKATGAKVTPQSNQPAPAGIRLAAAEKELQEIRNRGTTFADGFKYAGDADRARAKELKQLIPQLQRMVNP